MRPQFEYKFVRLGEGFLSVKKSGRMGYIDEVNKYASEDWRLVQIFAPGTGGYGSAKYFELVLERQIR